MLPKHYPAPTICLHDALFDKHQVEVYIKREDLLHPLISGNKYRKLKYNLLAAQEQGKTTLLTFGGAYSNHIHAAAAAGKECGLNTIGIIRGEEHLPLNPTLQFATACGMDLHYIDRSTYRQKHQPEFIESLRDKFGDFYLLPEGGTNLLALKGCGEIVEDIPVDFDYLCTACGTGGTMAGIIAGLKGEKQVIGFSALKGDFLIEEIRKLVKDYCGEEFSNWQVMTAYHFGGYAKIKAELIEFIQKFKVTHHIQLDPIYTGKMFYGIYDLIAQGFFPANSRIVALHTGGVQGIEGFKERLKIKD
jgi:1-aminocyclopropane-1-carboxylate deaminase